MKVPLTHDGSGVPVPLTAEEATEMRRESDEWDKRLADLLATEASYLNERFLEVQATGTTTMRSPVATWTATLQQSKWRDGWLVTKGARLDGRSGTSGGTRIGRKYKGEQLKRAVTLQLASGMLWLREVTSGETLPLLSLDGTRFSNLEGFYDEVSDCLIPGASWGRNLDAFNDILRGGFGTPDGGFQLRWLNSERSREQLGPLFDALVEIIEVHGPGGRESGDGVILTLE